jgi:hypothetical protein
MSERIQSHISNMKNINWDSPLQADIPDASQPTTHMMLLVKETGINMNAYPYRKEHCIKYCQSTWGLWQ